MNILSPSKNWNLESHNKDITRWRKKDGLKVITLIYDWYDGKNFWLVSLYEKPNTVNKRQTYELNWHGREIRKKFKESDLSKAFIFIKKLMKNE